MSESQGKAKALQVPRQDVTSGSGDEKLGDRGSAWGVSFHVASVDTVNGTPSRE